MSKLTHHRGGICCFFEKYEPCVMFHALTAYQILNFKVIQRSFLKQKGAFGTHVSYSGCLHSSLI